MIPTEWEEKLEKVIDGFPSPYDQSIRNLWEEWLASSPESPYYNSWSNFAVARDDQELLYSEKRIYVKRVTNELRELEIPLTTWQKVAKALAAVASIFLVIFLAISRVARATE